MLLINCGSSVGAVRVDGERDEEGMDTWEFRTRDIRVDTPVGVQSAYLPSFALGHDSET